MKLLALIGVAAAQSLRGARWNVTVPPGWDASPVYGTYQGNRLFNDAEELGFESSQVLSRITYSADTAYIEGLQASYYTDGEHDLVQTEYHGVSDSKTPHSTKTIDLSNGRYNKVEATAGGVVDYLKFYRAEGGFVEMGCGQGPQPALVKTYTAPEGMMIRGIAGSFNGVAIIQLAFLAGPDCQTIKGKITGQWQQIEYSSAPQQYTYTHGVQSSYTHTSTTTWGHTVSESISKQGFSFFGKSSKTTSVTNTHSKTISESFSQEFSQFTTISSSLTFPAGAIWQFVFNIEDTCGNTTVLGKDWVSTPSAGDYPCCPPGFAKDPSNQMGECIDPSLSVCK